MVKPFSSIKRYFSPVQLIPAGMYHYISPADDPRNYRLHLRIEPDGSGILVINASTILHLNQTAAEYAYYLVKNLPVDHVGKTIANRYNVSAAQAMKDYQELAERIQVMVHTPDLDPQTFLDFDRRNPFSGGISAPYRLDCALTYHYSGADSHQTQPSERVRAELSTSEWKTIIDKAASAGIPQIIFTGGEPTLRADLAELIAYAGLNDQVTGLISDGLMLADQDYLDSLLQTGLDHLVLVVSNLDQINWRSLENALAEDLFIAVHLTIRSDQLADITATIDQLASKGVRAISLSANDSNLQSTLETARSYLAARQLELVWNLPVPYSTFNPINFETDQVETKPGAGSAWLYVEPDGDVLPDQDINQVLGNLLTDPWEAIWKKSKNALHG